MISILKADHTIAVVDEMKQRLIKHHDINPRKISVVPNYETLDFAKKTKSKKKFNKKFKIIYVGNIGNDRGIDTVIRGLF